METVIIVVHLMVIVALVAVVLMQRSEGGALGIGGGGNFMSARGQGNVLTRATAILAAAFFATSIALTLLTRFGDRPASILDSVPAATTTAPAPGGSSEGNMLDQLDRMAPAPAPATTEPAAPSAPDVPTSQ
ncbi:MAG: preprotein translocase subunit SecG [Bauldia sp.]|nr:preprotein translocase subunit SecG [Bauldia sp.]